MVVVSVVDHVVVGHVVGVWLVVLLLRFSCCWYSSLCSVGCSTPAVGELKLPGQPLLIVKWRALKEGGEREIGLCKQHLRQ